MKKYLIVLVGILLLSGCSTSNANTKTKTCKSQEDDKVVITYDSKNDAVEEVEIKTTTIVNDVEMAKKFGNDFKEQIKGIDGISYEYELKDSTFVGTAKMKNFDEDSLNKYIELQLFKKEYVEDNKLSAKKVLNAYEELGMTCK